MGPLLTLHPHPLQEKRDSLPTDGWRSRWTPCPVSLGLAAWPALHSEPHRAGREGEGWLQTPLPPQSPINEKLIYTSDTPGVGRVSTSGQVPPSLGSAHLPQISVPGPAIMPLP